MSNKEAYVLFLAAEAKFPEWFKFTNQVARERLKLDAQDTEKIFVLQNIFHNHHIFDNYFMFEKAVKVINDVPSNLIKHQELTPAEITWAIKCIRKIDPESKFSEEVLAYIALYFYEDGFIELPDLIKKETSFQDNLTAQHFLDKYYPQFSSFHDEELIPHINDNQTLMHQSILKYIEYRESKIKKELDQEEV